MSDEKAERPITISANRISKFFGDFAALSEVTFQVRKGTVSVEGDLDFRGTLGVTKDAPVGFRAIRLAFDLDTDAGEEQLASLLKLTERYCVVLQTLRVPAETSASSGARAWMSSGCRRTSASRLLPPTASSASPTSSDSSTGSAS